MELGSEGNLGVDLLVGVRRLSAHASQPGMAGSASSACCSFRLSGNRCVLHRSQPFRHWLTQLWLVLRITSKYRVWVFGSYCHSLDLKGNPS